MRVLRSSAAFTPISSVSYNEINVFVFTTFWLLPRAPCEFVTLYQDIEDLGDSSRLLALSLAIKNLFSYCKVMILSLFTFY